MSTAKIAQLRTVIPRVARIVSSSKTPWRPPNRLVPASQCAVEILNDRGRAVASHRTALLAENLADLVRGQPPQPNLAGTFEDAVDGEVAFEDEIAAAQGPT